MAVLRSFGKRSMVAVVAVLLGAAATSSERAEALTVSTIVFNGAADTEVLAPAVRLRAPAPPVATTKIANTSNCRTDLSGAVGTVTIASIGYVCPVHAGGQSMLDAGAVTWMTGISTNPVLATHVGGPGTLWLAGHRTAHGGAFANVPDLADGAVITVVGGSGTASYRVVGRAYVQARNGVVLDGSGVATNAATLSALLREDLGGDGQPRLVLQTCDGPYFRWMIYADLIAK